MSDGLTIPELPQAPLPFLEAIGEAPREALLAVAARRTYPAGALMLAELEPGDEFLILLEGRAGVTVGSAELRSEAPLGEIGTGESVGEIALLTGALRSASVRALGAVTALAVQKVQLRELMARYPQIADHLLTLLAARLSAADRVLGRSLDPGRRLGERPLAGLDRQTREIAVRPQSLRRLLASAFRELVLEHRHELPFYLLSAFLCAFALTRAALFVLTAAGAPPEPLLRAAYVTGVLLLIGSAGLAPFVYRRAWRRGLCLAFGLGGGLLVNELSVWLAFDVFYSDVFTRDPTLAFDPASLYHRSAALWAFVLIAVLLAQATYLSRFYRRAYYLLRDRWAARR